MRDTTGNLPLLVYDQSIEHISTVQRWITCLRWLTQCDDELWLQFEAVIRSLRKLSDQLYTGRDIGFASTTASFRAVPISCSQNDVWPYSSTVASGTSTRGVLGGACLARGQTIGPRSYRATQPATWRTKPSCQLRDGRRLWYGSANHRKAGCLSSSALSGARAHERGAVGAAACPRDKSDASKRQTKWWMIRSVGANLDALR
jgi:hypothetical protein